MFTTKDASILENSLECLYLILAVGEKFKGEGKNPLIMDLYQLNAVDPLEELQYHNSEQVYSTVAKILNTYFEIQDPL